MMENNDVVFDDYMGYKGNINLKKSGVAVEWTPELVKEYIKCSQNPIYFVETYMKIITEEGLTSFTLRDYQKEMITSMAENRQTIIATARQAGKSTTTCGFVLWYIIFNSEKTAAILANKEEIAIEILSKVQLAYEHLPKWLQQGVVVWNKKSILLENNSRVIASATSASAIRGFAVNLLFIDEAAHIENWDEFFTSVYPTISAGKQSKIVLVSTPLGLNHFYALWSRAQQGKNDYTAIEVHWQKVPGRDAEWKKRELAAMNGDLEKFAQEYEVEFLGSSGTLIAGWKLKELVEREPLLTRDGIFQYKLPKKDHIYVAVADTSRGKGLDYSAFQIMDVTTMPYEQVCTYHNNRITPTEFAGTLHNICKIYHNAFLLVENNDLGQQVADIIFEYSYEYLLYTDSDNRKGGGKKVTLLKGNRGITTSKVVKSVGCSLIKLLIEQNQLILHDEATITEFKTFSKKKNSYEAEEGKHDDLVMCCVLFAWLSDQEFFRDITDINTVSNLRDKTEEELMEDLLPFGVYYDDGAPDDTIIREIEYFDRPDDNYY